MPFISVIIIHLEMLTRLIDGVISQMAKEVVKISLIWSLESCITSTLLYVAKRTMPSL